MVRGAGIDPTGVTDSTAAIQALINAAGVGASIYFPIGATFEVTALTPLDGQRWWGWGTLCRKTGTIQQHVVTGTDLTGFELTEVTVDGNAAGATATSASAVYLERSTDTRIYAATFLNCSNSNPAVELRGSVRGVVRDSLFSAVGYGVIVGLEYGSTDDCDGNTVSGNKLYDIGTNGIFVTENIGTSAGTVAGLVSDTLIVGNTIRGWGDAAIEIGSGCRGATVTGNTLNGLSANAFPGASGILIRDGHDVNCIGNTVLNVGTPGSDGDGITVQSLNDESARLNIAANTVRNCARYGLFVNGFPPDSRVLPGANTITGSGVSDVFVLDPDNDATAFQAPSGYTNGWSDPAFAGYAPAGFSKDASGYVHLRGYVDSGTAPNAAFTLPVGYRPAYKTEGTNIEVSSAGEVICVTTGPKNLASVPPFLAEL